MNGIHDMGGMTDFGPIVLEPNEPLFHAAWEARVMGLVRNIVDKHYNWDEFRFAIERLTPTVYLSSSYYERWLNALERYLLEKGVLEESEMAGILDGWGPQPGLPVPSEDHREPVEAITEVGPRFKVGDTVVTRNINPSGHTRLPRYVRGKRGRVARFQGMFVFPDTNSLGLGTHLQPVYAVRFAASDLWGEEAGKADGIYVDLWEQYLLPV